MCLLISRGLFDSSNSPWYQLYPFFFPRQNSTHYAPSLPNATDRCSITYVPFIARRQLGSSRVALCLLPNAYMIKCFQCIPYRIRSLDAIVMQSFRRAAVCPRKSAGNRPDFPSRWRGWLSDLHDTIRVLTRIPSSRLALIYRGRLLCKDVVLMQAKKSLRIFVDDPSNAQSRRDFEEVGCQSFVHASHAFFLVGPSRHVPNASIGRRMH